MCTARFLGQLILKDNQWKQCCVPLICWTSAYKDKFMIYIFSHGCPGAVMISCVLQGNECFYAKIYHILLEAGSSKQHVGPDSSSIDLLSVDLTN